MDKFVIKRSEWARGYGGEMHCNYLLSADDGKKCCLGFFSLACGLSEKQILNRPGPLSCLPEGEDKYPSWLFTDIVPTVDSIHFGSSGVDKTSSDDVSFLIKYNDMDNEFISDEDREAKIKEIFAKHNITVEFED